MASESGQEMIPHQERFYEVLTDEAKVIGKSDPENGLEAVPIGCGITIFVDKKIGAVGMIHSNMLIEKTKAMELVADIVWGFKSRGGDIKDAQITGYKLGEINLEAIKQGLKGAAGITSDFPNEPIITDGVRVKKDGSIKGFNFPHRN